MFEISRQSDAILHEAHAAMADFLNVSRPEEIIFGNNMTTLNKTPSVSQFAWLLERHKSDHLEPNS